MRSTSNSPTDAARAVTAEPPRVSLDARAGTCLFCRSALAGRYCHACGEDSLPVESTWQGAVAQWQRLVRTLRALLLEPGRLAEYHLAGARVRYIPPMTLFLNAVAITFLLSALTDFRVASIVHSAGKDVEPLIERRASELGVSRDAVVERAERRFQAAYTLSLCLISGVGYTLFYRLLYRTQLPTWRAAFTYVLNYLAWLFVFFLPFLLLGPPVRHAFGQAGMLAFFAAGLAMAVAWQAVVARRIAGHRWPVALGKAATFVAGGYVLDGVMTGVAVATAIRFA